MEEGKGQVGEPECCAGSGGACDKHGGCMSREGRLDHPFPTKKAKRAPESTPSTATAAGTPTAPFDKGRADGLPQKPTCRWFDSNGEAEISEAANPEPVVPVFKWWSDNTQYFDMSGNPIIPPVPLTIPKKYDDASKDEDKLRELYASFCDRPEDQKLFREKPKDPPGRIHEGHFVVIPRHGKRQVGRVCLFLLWRQVLFSWSMFLWPIRKGFEARAHGHTKNRRLSSSDRYRGTPKSRDFFLDGTKV